MDVVDIVDAAKRANVALEVKANRLVIQYDIGIVDFQLLQSIREHETSIVEHLSLPVPQVKDWFSGKDDQDIVAFEDQEHYPVSHAQYRLWLHDQQIKQDVTYLVPVTYDVPTEVGINEIEKAFRALIERHESLRTKFLTVAGEPRQMVVNPSEVSVLISSHRLLPGQSINSLGSGTEPFDLTAVPLMRVDFFETPGHTGKLRITIHHIVTDEWSMNVIYSDLARFVSQGHMGSRLSFQYKDYTLWHNALLASRKSDNARRFWETVIANEFHPLDIQRPIRQKLLTSSGKSISIRIAGTIHERLRKQMIASNCSMFVTVLACISSFLYRYNRGRNIRVGSSGLGRYHSDLDDQVGFYVNLMLLSSDIKSDDSFANVLEKMSETTFNALENQLYPIDLLLENHKVSELKIPFHIFLSMHSEGLHQTMPDASFGKVKPYPIKFDLSLDVEEYAEGMIIHAHFNEELFEPDRISQLLTHLQCYLDNITQNPEKKIVDVDYIDSFEKAKISTLFNRTDRAIRSESIQELFQQQAIQTPDRIAVIFGDQSITYDQLNARSNQLSHYLINTGVKRGDLIGIMINRSHEMLVVVLAILKAGCAYVPIDKEYPEARRQYIINDSGVVALLVDQYDEVVVHSNCIDISAMDWVSLDSTLPIIDYHQNDLMYVLYTSGTTGQPKGVMIENRSVVNLCEWLRQEVYDQYRSPVKGMLTASINFDASVQQLFTPIISGNTLIVSSKESKENPKLYIEDLQRYGIEVMDTTPALLNLVLDQLDGDSNGDMPVKSVLVGGDRLPDKDIGRYHLHFASAELINVYGPTECTVDSTFEKVSQREQKGQIIGKPIPNAKIYILDPFDQPCGIGVIGELCIGGVGLARGYLNREELTSSKFTVHPADKTIKIYRTGDLARWLMDGRVEFLGREDGQLKIRGFRIEGAEIENTLRQYTGIQQALVQTTREGLDKELIIYYTGQWKEPSDIRDYLGKRLPYYMVPSHVIHLASLPLTTHGKIDVKALPTVDQRNSKYAPPRNETESRMIGLWEQVLHTSPVGVHDNFFDLGGHSLKATRLAMAIYQEFKSEVSIRAIFSNPTVGLLCDELCSQSYNHSKLRPTAIILKEDQEHYSLSHAQRRLWGQDQLTNDRTVYNIQVEYDIQGVIDTTVLELALRKTISMHDSLRTVFITVDGVPRQRVREVEPSWILLDVADLTVSDKQVKTKEEIRNIQRLHAFDLSQGPLLRACLIKVTENSCLIVITMHHIISDEWSMPLFFDHLRKNFLGHVIPPLRVQYKDYTYWQKEQLQNEQVHGLKQYWKNKLVKPLPDVLLTNDFPRPAIFDTSGIMLTSTLDQSVSGGLRRIAQQANTSLFIVLHAFLKLFLYRYSGQKDIIVGTPVSGRSNAELENQVGFYVNMIPLRSSSLSGERSFDQWLEEIKNETLEAFDHDFYPFDAMFEDLDLGNDLSRSPLFDVVLVVAEKNTSEQEMPVLQSPSIQDANSKFDLLFHFNEYQNGILLSITYASSIYSQSRVLNMLNLCQVLVQQIVQYPSRPVKNLNLLPEEHRKQLRKMGMGLVRENSPLLVLDYLTHWSKICPDKIGVIGSERTLNYEQLERSSTLLACSLLKHGVVSGDRVAIFQERSEKMIVSILAVLKAGASYVPIDISYPQERIRYMIEDSRPHCVLVDKLHSIFGELFQCIVEDSFYSTSEPEYSFQPPSADSLAYVMYTSGTTGNPKGVMISHRAVMNTVYAQQDVIMHDDRVLQFASISFDASVYEIFSAVTIGCTLVMLPANLDNYSDALIDYMRLQNVSLTLLPPVLIKMLPLEDLKFLRCLITGGEAADSKSLLTLIPSVNCYNAYGPTEASVCVTMEKIGMESFLNNGTVVIGTPLPNMEILLLDDAHQQVALGSVGEMYISGYGLSSGYWANKELTDEKFVVHPLESTKRMYQTGDLGRWLENGKLEFLGRKDFQLKIRGHRVEPAEIEVALLKIEDIEQAVVISRSFEGEEELIAYYVGHLHERNYLREQLISLLPSYMIPKFFVHQSGLPITANGKVDCAKLPMPPINIVGVPVAPTSALEEALLVIWRNVLHQPNIGIHDNFFVTGGHSLKASRLVMEVYQRLSIQLNLRAIFNYPSVYLLANHMIDEGLFSPLVMKAQSYKSLIFPLVEKSGGGVNLFLLPPVLGLPWVFQSLANAMGKYVNSCGLLQPGIFDAQQQCSSIQMLALQFANAILEYQPEGVYRIMGYSMGCQTAFEIAKIISDRNYEVELILIDRDENQEKDFLTQTDIDTLFAHHIAHLNLPTSDQEKNILHATFTHNINISGNYKINGVARVNKMITVECGGTESTLRMGSWNTYIESSYREHYSLDSDHFAIIDNNRLAELLLSHLV